MGRKIEIKKIDDNIKSQVTFSKRRTSLIKRANEISVMCDVDVALLAFSPAGRISQFCSRDKMLDMIEAYTNLPTEERFSYMKNIKGKMAKLEQLNTLQDNDAKARYLDERIEKLKAQVENSQREVQIAEANLGDYEPDPSQQPSLLQLSWCENNLQKCLEKMKQLKLEKLIMENEGAIPSMYINNGNNQFQPKSTESWKDKEYKYPENIFSQMLGKGKGKEVADTNGVPFQIASYGLNLHHPAVVPETQTWLSDASLQVNANPVYLQQYIENSASNKVWMEAPVPQQQSENLNFSFGNFSGEKNNNYYLDYPFGWPKSNFMGMTSFDIPMSKKQPNQVYDETNGMEKSNEVNNNNEENGDGLPLVQYSPSTSGIPSALFDNPLFQDPLAELSTVQNAEGVDKAWNGNN